jgi:hypothetical protein
MQQSVVSPVFVWLPIGPPPDGVPQDPPLAVGGVSSTAKYGVPSGALREQVFGTSMLVPPLLGQLALVEPAQIVALPPEHCPCCGVGHEQSEQVRVSVDMPV